MTKEGLWPGETSPPFGGVAMNATIHPIVRPLSILFLFGLACLAWIEAPAQAGPKPDTYWQVEDIHAGMTGRGRTVMKGTKVETFDAEVLGVLKNTKLIVVANSDAAAAGTLRCG